MLPEPLEFTHRGAEDGAGISSTITFATAAARTAMSFTGVRCAFSDAVKIDPAEAISL